MDERARARLRAVARQPTGESVLARAVRLLDAFTAEEPTLTVGELARRSGLHVATASRLVAELVAQGLLERGPGRQVRVGVRLWELGARASPPSRCGTPRCPSWRTCTPWSGTTRSSACWTARTCCSWNGSAPGTRSSTTPASPAGCR